MPDASRADRATESPPDSGGAAGPSTWSRPGLGCPRCGNPKIWQGWAAMDASCSSCGLEFGRHGWSGAMWINTWITLLAVVGWMVTGFTLTGTEAGWSLGGGALVIAGGLPLACYPWSKTLMVRLLLRLDPPPDGRPWP